MDNKTNVEKEKTVNGHPLTMSEVVNACIIDDRPTRGRKVGREISDGLAFIREHPKSVTIFGSSKLGPENIYYSKAENLAKKIVEETGYAVTTGGGPGIMEGANKGAKEAGGHSLGLGIELPREQEFNSYVTEQFEFHYFFTRKVGLAFSAEVYIFFPGGFGTLDEFFEIITLVQNKKIQKVPIILVGNEFWEPLDKIIREHLFEKFGTIGENDSKLYTMTEDEDKILEIIKKAPLRKED
jgi:uncharacterized protein (TIGR00730 family)